MAIETVGIRAVVDRLDQYLQGTAQMQKSLDALVTANERVAKASEKAAAAQAAAAQSAQNKAASTKRAAKAEEEHLTVLQKVEKQLRRNLAGSLQFTGAFFIIKAQQAVFEGLAATIVGMNSKLEQASIAFTTMLGSARQAGSFLQTLQQFAAETPFEFEGLVTASQRMLAYGFTAQQVLPLLTAIGDATAGLGSGTQGIERITTALGQMQQKGKVTGEELRQLAEAGIPGLKLLGQELGKTTAEISAMVENGEISSDVFIKAFKNFSEVNFGGLMEKQSKTFLGALTTIKDQLLIVGSTAFKPLFQAISSLTLSIANASQGEGFKAFGVAMAAVVAQGTFLIPIIAALGVAFLRWVAAIVIARAQIILGNAALAAFNGTSLITISRANLLLLAFLALDATTKVLSGRSLTERILGIGGAATDAEGEIKRLQDRLDALGEAGVPKAQAQNIVSQDASNQLQDYVEKLHEAVSASKDFKTVAVDSNLGVRLARQLGFIKDPLKDASTNVRQLTAFLIENTKTADQLRAAYLDRPDLEKFLSPEVARRSAAELKTLIAEQQANAIQSIATAQRTGEALDIVSEGIAAQAASGNVWAAGIQKAVEQTNNKVSIDLKELEEAFAHLPTNIDEAQKIINKLFVGGKESNAARLFKDVIAPQIADGVKAVEKEMQALIPGTDEIFAEWLARLEKHTSNLLAFSNNLRYIFKVLSAFGSAGVSEFIHVLEQAGPDTTAAVASMIAIDPIAAGAKFSKTADALAGTMTGKLADGVVAQEATTQDKLTLSFSRMYTVALDNAQTRILTRIAELNRRAVAGVSDINEAAALGNAQAFNAQQAGADVRYSADPTKPPIIVNPVASEQQGAIDKINRENERLAREAEAAAKEAARLFEEALAKAIRTPSTVVNEAFSRFWELTIGGFKELAQKELANIPEVLQPLVDKITKLSQEARQRQSEIINAASGKNGISFPAVTAIFTGDKSHLNDQLNPFRQMIESGDLADSIATVQQLMESGLINAKGEAGDAARQYAEAVTGTITDRMESLAPRIQERFANIFSLRFFNFDAGNFFEGLPQQLQPGIKALSDAAANGELLRRELDEMSRINLGSVFSSEFLGQDNKLEEATQNLEVFTRAASDFGGIQQYGLAAVTAYAYGLDQGSGPAAEAARRVVENVKNVFESSIAVAEELGGNIADALRNQNNAQRDALVGSLDDQIQRRQDFDKVEEESINKQSRDRIKGINKQQQAARDALQLEQDNLQKSAKLTRDFYDERERGIRRAVQANQDAAHESSDAEIEALNKTVEVSKETADARIEDINRVQDARDKAFDRQIDLLNREKDAIDKALEDRFNKKELDDQQKRIAEIDDLLNTITSKKKREPLLKERQDLVDQIDEDAARQAAKAQKDNIDIQIKSTQDQQKALKETGDTEIETLQKTGEAYQKTVQIKIDAIQKQVEANDKATANYLDNLAIETTALKGQNDILVEQAAATLEARKKASDAEFTDRLEKEQADTQNQLTQFHDQEKNFLASLNTRKTDIQNFYNELNSDPNIKKGVLAIIEQGPAAVTAILTAHNPDFQLAGRTIGQLIINGANFPAIGEQIATTFSVIRAGRSAREAIAAGQGIGNDFTGGIKYVIPSDFVGIGNSLTEQWGKTVAGIGPSVVNDGAVVGDGFIDGAIRGVTGGKQRLATAADTAIRDMFNQALAADSGRAAADAAINAAATQFNLRKVALNMSVTSSSAQSLPHFAVGAVVSKPTTAVIGEVPEVVAPLSKLVDIIRSANVASGGGNGHGDTYITVQGSIVTQDDIFQLIRTENEKNARRNT